MNEHMLKFSSRILMLGINPYVSVSSKQARTLQAGWRKPMPVLVQVNGAPKPPAKVNMMPAGDGSFYLYLNGDIRKASGAEAGHVVDVIIRFDASYEGGPQHAMPHGLAVALDQAPQAHRNWKALPPSRQKEVLRYLAGLKSAEALSRNIERCMRALSGVPTRFMARDWRNGR